MIADLLMEDVKPVYRVGLLGRRLLMAIHRIASAKMGVGETQVFITT